MPRLALLTRSCRPQVGQASVEFLGVVPAVLVVGVIVWQLALTGHAAWLCANAARVAARAEAVGADGESAARTALPQGLERGLRVERDRATSGRVRVELRVPFLVHSWRTPWTVAASAYLADRP